MKVNIDKLVYNTDTAKVVSSWENGKDGPCRVVETLYRKITGEYFLHIVGGASIIYDKGSGSVSTGADEKIVPLGYEEAREWAGRHYSADDVSKMFSSGGKRVYSRLDGDAARLLDAEVSRSGRKMYEVINDCIIKQLGKRKK